MKKIRLEKSFWITVKIIPILKYNTYKCPRARGKVAQEDHKIIWEIVKV